MKNSQMTKSNYELIARAIERATVGQHIDPENLANLLARYFAHNDPRFDRNKFLQACGIDYHAEFNESFKLSDIKLVNED